ncbi:MAG TPA: HAD family phosphatase [Treponemataceae bacterium]|nr:HAD family phosphatase [Treponemataceae bacterium]HQL04164.1 HAD family phosphatase [Treponemataceae bacterium]
MLEAVIFDMDGLLFDTEKLCMEMWQAQGDKEGIAFSKELFYKCIGRNNKDTKHIVLESLGNDFPYEEFRKKASLAMRENMDTFGPPKKQGLHELFSFLKEHKIKIALATSTSRESALWMIKRAGIDNYFDAFAFGNEVEHGKPAPDIFLHAASLLNVSPEHCIVYEDSEAGLRAAHSARMRSVFIKDLLLPPEEVLLTVWKSCTSLDDSIKELKTLIDL